MELNESAREYARENYKLEVFDEEGLKYLSENAFDLITLWHVLEHVPNLHQRLEEIKRLIRKDGFLVIAVPNLEASDAKKYGEKWAALDVPRHLYHFTGKTMGTLLNQFDFQIKSVFPLKMDAYYVSMLSEKYRGNGFPFFKAILEGYNSNKAALKNNNYSSMVFVAQQK